MIRHCSALCLLPPEVPVWSPPAGDQPQLIQGIRRRDGLGDYLYANQRCQEQEYEESSVGRFGGEKRLSSLDYAEDQSNFKTRRLHHLRRPQAPSRIAKGASPYTASPVGLSSPGIISKPGGFRAPDGDSAGR